MLGAHVRTLRFRKVVSELYAKDSEYKSVLRDVDIRDLVQVTGCQ